MQVVKYLLCVHAVQAFLQEVHLNDNINPVSYTHLDGKLYLLYTGHVDLDNSNGGNDRIETQCLAVSDDGKHFEKVENNPVIKALPENLNIRTEHFRDPKVWKHGDWSVSYTHLDVYKRQI